MATTSYIQREFAQSYDVDGELDHLLAQEIVSRTMSIIQCNVNIMNNRGVIIGSGQKDRIGERHDGACLALKHGEMYTVDANHTQSMQGVQPGINMPIRQNDKVVGVIGLTGDPANLRQYAKLVTMTAEMMLEQSRLLSMLAQDQRLREELVLNLIHNEGLSEEQREWATRLGIDLSLPRVAVLIECDSSELPVSDALYELQYLLEQLRQPEHNNLVARVSLNYIVVLKPALNQEGTFSRDLLGLQIEKMYKQLNSHGKLRLHIASGHYFPGAESISRSFNTALTTLKIGKIYSPSQHTYAYQQLRLPVLLEALALDRSWQTGEFLQPLNRLKAVDTNGLLRKTLLTWFNHNNQISATAQALFIHRNTLEYRLNKVSELTNLDVRGNFFDRTQLYIGLQLDCIMSDPGKPPLNV